jgi:S1/P1 Nuclease
MKRISTILIALTIFLATSVPTFGWGDKGHRTVGQIAQIRLANTHALERIKNILNPDESLASVSVWADNVKEEENFRLDANDDDPDTEHFFRQLVNKHNREWHFVDLPLHCSGYNDLNCKSFTAANDIVHMINLSIRKLRGENVPQLKPRNALRLLVHLVGDLHQPLHVGVGYINVDENNQIVIERDAATIRENHFPADRGGNDFLITGQQSPNLHSFWDGDLVSQGSTGQNVIQFATALNNGIPQTTDWDGQGNFKTWAAQWASDTLRVSNEHAYDNTVRPFAVVIINDRQQYNTEIGGNYKSKNIPVVKLQLAKGGYRLAKLLEAIFP